MKKIIPILLAFFFAGTLLAATITPELPSDLGAITTAWRITYHFGNAQTETAVFALAEKEVWGTWKINQGANIDLVEILNSESSDSFTSWIGRSLAYSDDGTGSTYEWNFRVKTTVDTVLVPKTVTVTLEPVMGLGSGIPSDSQLDILNADGSLFQTVEDPAESNEVTLTTNKTYILRFTVAKRYGEAGCNITLQPGWNLAGIPLETLESAGTLLDYLVLDPANNNVRVTAVAQLSGGRAYWVYNGTGAEKTVALSGQAPLVAPSHLPEMHSRWNFVSPIAKYDEEHETFSLCDVDGLVWDTETQSFQPVNGPATLGQGYIIQK